VLPLTFQLFVAVLLFPQKQIISKKRYLFISAALYFALGYFGCVIYQSKPSPIAFADSFKLSLICLLVGA